MDQDASANDELSDSFHDLLSNLNNTSTEQAISNAPWNLGTSNAQPRSGSPLRSPITVQSPIATSSSPRSASRPLILQQRRTPSTLQDQNPTVAESSTVSSQLNPPHRSIFASGPPTSSISVNTAQASLSTASGSGSSRPLAALTGTGVNRRSSRPVDVPTTPVPGTEKDVDDLGGGFSPPTLDPDLGSTSQKLSSLFVSDAETPGPLSREMTQLRSLSNVGRTSNDTSTLTGHLFYNGFLGGRHSDITVHAFGQSYRLHKLLLDRAPFFSSAFSGPWTESSASEMTVIPEDIDPNITKTAFELALKRLYGTAILTHEEQEAVGLFATACWLDMLDLVDSCVDYILRQMHPSKLHALIRLVTNNYYGKAGDRILASSKAMLCREGWEMPYEYWDEIPAEIVREIIGGDAFYVPGEWERWFLTLKLLNRRLRKLATDNGLVASDGVYIHSKPQSLRFSAVRQHNAYQRESGFGSPQSWSEKDDAWYSLYASSEVSPLLVLLDEGIHYVHLRFEQLQQIRSAKDILGVPVLPDKIISDALWMSMELRQRILNAHEGDLELGFSEFAEEYDESEDEPVQSETSRGKQKEGSQPPQISGSVDSGSWDGTGRPRKFWIPTNDVSCIMGGAREAVATPSATSSGDWTKDATRLSASLEPTDVAWAADFAGSMFESNSPARNFLSTSSPRFSYYPPFRFCAEFPNPRTLKEKKRVYSQTVWYAGSMWNLYIQRVNTSKNQQLGIYLHRAKDKDPSDDPLAQFVPASVDDRIGQLEREIIMRKTERRARHWREEVLASGGDPDQDTGDLSHHLERLGSPESGDNHQGTSFFKDAERGAILKTSQTPAMPSAAAPVHHRTTSSHDINMLSPESEEEDAFLIRTNQKFSSTIATMPPYIDSRSTIKTYFKIYSPSKAGRLLSVYESAPDSFNFGKSWGWKSSQMVLDDGLGGYEKGSAKDGKLRYMVVIGNV